MARNGAPLALSAAGQVKKALRRGDTPTAKYVALLVRLDEVATVVSIYRKAFKTGELALCWKIREDIQNRITGIPYRAVNPLKDSKTSDLYNDARVQIAIQNLIQPPVPPQLPPQESVTVESEAVA